MLSEALENVLKKQTLKEDRTVFDDGSVEIDNFQTVKELIKFENPGDTLYFIQIKKRDKDNPGQHSRYQAAMHLKEYYIKSLAELEQNENEIKSICSRENARAYIWLNPRSKAVVDQYTERNMRAWKRNPSMGRMYGWKAQALAAAKSLDIDERPLCFVDVDSDDQEDINMAMKVIQTAGITPLFAYRSVNNGIHIILPDKEQAKKLNFDAVNFRGLSPQQIEKAKRNFTDFQKRNLKVGIEIDKPALLYTKLIPQGYDKQNARISKAVKRL